MSRIPIRLRLTLAFAVAMAIVLAATGAFLYERLGSSLDETINHSLDARLADVSALAAGTSSGLGAAGRRIDPEESFAQILDSKGHVVDETPLPAGRRPLLGPDQLARIAEAGVFRVEVDDAGGIEGPARLLARAIDAPQGRRTVVVGASLEDRNEALSGLLAQLLVIGPIALVLVSLLGYGLATAALRPVESMRAEAAAISAAQPDRRLPVPSSQDEVSRLAETLNAMLGRLGDALERERNFVADASHELRTPLALLKAELELALRRPRSQDELELAIRSAAGEADRLAQLADDLLVLARSDRDQLPLRREPIAVRDVAARAAARFATHARAGDRTIEVETPNGLSVVGDQLRLEQALGNLVANALRHGGGSIHINAVERDGRVELHVLDKGPGFPPAFLPRAFERFSRADEARSGGGAGLGLAIAAVIARAHGGEAHAVNRADGGADVWLSIPR